MPLSFLVNRAGSSFPLRSVPLSDLLLVITCTYICYVDV